MWADNPRGTERIGTRWKGQNKYTYIFIFLRSCLYGHTASQAVAGRPLQEGAKGCPVPHALASRLCTRGMYGTTGVGRRQPNLLLSIAKI